MSNRIRIAALLLAAATISLAGCATPRADGPAAAPTASAPRLGDVEPAPPEGEVTAQGTVLDKDGSVELCLGAIAESYPPQCSGIPLEGWNWEEVDGEESAAAITWGAYAVTGTFDGSTFTVTQPAILLALYDPMRPEDPTDGEPGHTSESTLIEIQDELLTRLGPDLLSSWPERGYLWIQVRWDDGTLQDAADAEFGDDVVIVQSALRQF
ncbi:hypothetical protein [Microbacterium stercoris]|uniref:Uncharacterized protein n=1 Tax=Microbacterium stercoris TaxID=2820289 RepID=A0A939QJP1_9MICO|nr:hypothetical protein [Microbacterium stercoris]MBO3664158.1 hypothetical protein [Microbacterium stercoris]